MASSFAIVANIFNQAKKKQASSGKGGFLSTVRAATGRPAPRAAAPRSAPRAAAPTAKLAGPSGKAIAPPKAQAEAPKPAQGGLTLDKIREALNPKAQPTPAANAQPGKKGGFLGELPQLMEQQKADNAKSLEGRAPLKTKGGDAKEMPDPLRPDANTQKAPKVSKEDQERADALGIPVGNAEPGGGDKAQIEKNKKEREAIEGRKATTTQEDAPPGADSAEDQVGADTETLRDGRRDQEAQANAVDGITGSGPTDNGGFNPTGSGAGVDNALQFVGLKSGNFVGTTEEKETWRKDMETFQTNAMDNKAFGIDIVSAKGIKSEENPEGIPLSKEDFRELATRKPMDPEAFDEDGTPHVKAGLRNGWGPDDAFTIKDELLQEQLDNPADVEHYINNPPDINDGVNDEAEREVESYVSWGRANGYLDENGKVTPKGREYNEINEKKAAFASVHDMSPEAREAADYNYEVNLRGPTKPGYVDEKVNSDGTRTVQIRNEDGSVRVQYVAGPVDFDGDGSEEQLVVRGDESDFNERRGLTRKATGNTEARMNDAPQEDTEPEAAAVGGGGAQAGGGGGGGATAEGGAAPKPAEGGGAGGGAAPTPAPAPAPTGSTAPEPTGPVPTASVPRGQNNIGTNRISGGDSSGGYTSTISSLLQPMGQSDSYLATPKSQQSTGRVQSTFNFPVDLSQNGGGNVTGFRRR